MRGLVITDNENALLRHDTEKLRLLPALCDRFILIQKDPLYRDSMLSLLLAEKAIEK